jgi:hypothetical protein
MTTTAGLHPHVDMELKKAFDDLQVKMITSRAQMKAISSQMEQLNR